MLGGWWQSIKEGYGEGGINGVAGAIAGLATGYADFVGAGLSNGYKEAKDSWSFMGAIGGFGFMDSIIKGVKDGWSWVAETVKGLFTNTTSQQAPEPASETIPALSILELRRRLKEKGNSENEEVLANKLLDYMEKIAERQSANKDKVENGEWYSAFDNTKEAFDYIQTKKLLGEPLTADDARMLAQTMKQRTANGEFAKEFADYIRDNSDKFDGFKIEGLDVKDDKSIIEFANHLSKTSCFINTIFMNIVLSPVTEGVPQSFGDMYVKAQESKLIGENGINSTQSMNTEKGVQAWIDGIIGAGKLDVEGYFKGDGTKESDIMNKIQDLAGKGALASGGRIDAITHSMMQALVNGTWGIFDTGKYSFVNPRPYGEAFDKYYGRNNTSSFWILTIQKIK